MKRLTALCICLLLVSALVACGTTVPASYPTAVRYEGKALPAYSVLIGKGGQNGDVDGEGSEKSPAELIVKYKEEIPFTFIQDGRLDYFAGYEPKTKCSIGHFGIYSKDGIAREKATAEALLTLPDGSYIICVEEIKSSKKESSRSYIFVGIEKNDFENNYVSKTSDGEYCLLLHSKKEILAVDRKYRNDMKKVTDELVRSAEEKIEAEAAKYPFKDSNGVSYFVERNSDGALCLFGMLLVYFDSDAEGHDESACGVDHDHISFCEPIVPTT